MKLKEAGFTVVSFVPKITHVDSPGGSEYLSIFATGLGPVSGPNGEPAPADGLGRKWWAKVFTDKQFN